MVNMLVKKLEQLKAKKHKIECKMVLVKDKIKAEKKYYENLGGKVDE